MKFDGKKWPKSADELIGGGKANKPMSKEQWLGFINAMEKSLADDEPRRKKKKKSALGE